MLGSGMVLGGIPAVFALSAKTQAPSPDYSCGLAARVITVVGLLAIAVYLLLTRL